LSRKKDHARRKGREDIKVFGTGTNRGKNIECKENPEGDF
jgi:hypothetical protein